MFLFFFLNASHIGGYSWQAKADKGQEGKFRVNLGYTVSSRLAQVCKTQSQERTKPNVVTGLAQEPSFSIGQNLKKETVYFLNTGLH